MKIIYFTLLISIFVSGCAGQIKTNLSSLEYTKNSYGKATRQLAGHFSLCTSNQKVFIKENWSRLVERANACVYKKSWNALKVLATYMSERDYNSPWGSYFLSVYEYQKKNLMYSLWLIDAAIKKAPQVGLLYYHKSQILSENAQNQKAFKLMKKAIRLDDTLVDAHVFLAQSYMRDQQLDLAEKHWKKILILEPKNSLSKKHLAEIKKIKNQNKNIKTKISQR